MPLYFIVSKFNSKYHLHPVEMTYIKILLVIVSARVGTVAPSVLDLKPASSKIDPFLRVQLDYYTEMESSGESFPLSDDDESTGWGYCDSDSEGEVGDDWVEPALLTKVIYDQARDEAWLQASYEISNAERNILTNLSLRRKDEYNIRTLSGFVMNKMWVKIRSTLSDMTESTFKKIILTFYFISSFGMSATDFFDNHHITKTAFCNQSDYFNFWKNIHALDSRTYDVSHRTLKQELLEVINVLYHDYFSFYQFRLSTGH